MFFVGLLAVPSEDMNLEDASHFLLSVCQSQLRILRSRQWNGDDFGFKNLRKRVVLAMKKLVLFQFVVDLVF